LDDPDDFDTGAFEPPEDLDGALRDGELGLGAAFTAVGLLTGALGLGAGLRVGLRTGAFGLGGHQPAPMHGAAWKPTATTKATANSNLFKLHFISEIIFYSADSVK
jgi:hypothetical protein